VKGFDARNHGDKETRAVATEIKMEAGELWFPSAPWVSELESELLGFPNAAPHDDQVDALSMGCILAGKYAGKAEEPLTQEQAHEKATRAEQDRFQKLLWSGCPW
jgi:hypothetical protein